MAAAGLELTTFTANLRFRPLGQLVSYKKGMSNNCYSLMESAHTRHQTLAFLKDSCLHLRT